MEQMILGNHIVKPSSPTPNTSKTHKLSFLDEMAPPFYIPLILLYENNPSEQQEEISRRLRQSLSEILTIFYPLAGTINENSLVDCDDTGAEFVEARVHARLAQFIQDPKIEDLVKKLVPVDSSSHNDNLILLVKTSFFDCGGIAVGVCLSHKIADAASLATFVNAWGAACRGEVSRIIRPSFDLALHFPPRHFSWPSSFCLGVTKEKIVTRRLVFEKEKVERIKNLEASRGEVKDPSRVEAVSGFLWRSFIEAHRRVGAGTTTSFPASHVVNLRRRAVPPLPDHAFGNCFMMAPTDVLSDEDEDVLVSRLRAAIRGVDGDFINQVIKDESLSRSLDEAGNIFVKSGNCVFTSWYRFPVYEVDFGWGKPVRVCTAAMPYMNLVVLMDIPSGDGIEAWVNVRDDHFFRLIQANFNKLFA